MFEKNLATNRELLRAATPQKERAFWQGVVEIHKTDNGKVMIVGYVDQGTAARLSEISRPVGILYLYHEPERENQVLVGIPASRIIDWDYRQPHEFSEIEID